jgi:hypothetical protein
MAIIIYYDCDILADLLIMLPQELQPQQLTAYTYSYDYDYQIPIYDISRTTTTSTGAMNMMNATP